MGSRESPGVFPTGLHGPSRSLSRGGRGGCEWPMPRCEMRDEEGGASPEAGMIRLGSARGPGSRGAGGWEGQRQAGWF